MSPETWDLCGARQIVTFRAEGSYQFGSMGDMDINAFMFGARIGASFAGGAGQVILWYDYLSGDSDPTDNTVRVFNTLFATNHKFYGFADIFLNIPVHTGGLGLQDVALKASYTVTPDIKLQADFHVFATGKRGNLDSRRFGEELDITTNYRYSRDVSFIGGVSHVFAGDALAAIGRFSDDLTFAYLMLDAKL